VAPASWRSSVAGAWCARTADHLAVTVAGRSAEGPDEGSALPGAAGETGAADAGSGAPAEPGPARPRRALIVRPPSTRPDDADERRLRADVPPHHGE